MHSKMFEKIKYFYEKGLWTAEQVHLAVEKGIITEDEYELIVHGGN